jgi:hypothetical protein
MHKLTQLSERYVQLKNQQRYYYYNENHLCLNKDECTGTYSLLLVLLRVTEPIAAQLGPTYMAAAHPFESVENSTEDTRGKDF